MNKPDGFSIAFLLRWLAGFVLRHPRKIVFFETIAAGLAVFYTVSELEIHTKRNDLVGSERRYHQNYLTFKADFDVRDEIVVVVESESTERNRQFVERLGAKLLLEPELFGEVFYKGDFAMLGDRALYFLDQDELEAMEQKLIDFKPFLQEFTKTTSLVDLFEGIKDQFREGADNPEGARAMLDALPALNRIVGGARAALERRGTAPSPGVEALFSAGEQAQQRKYITYGDGTIYLLSALPASEPLTKEAIRRLRSVVESVKGEVAGVNVGITGKTVLDMDEMLQAKADTTKASILAVVLVIALFALGFHEFWRPILASICLLYALAFTMAYTTAVVGHLNILTITFAPILIGLAIDFGVHLISRYEEELLNGALPDRALECSMVRAGTGIFTGCVTTAGAFLVMAFTDFKGIQEMGVITGGGMLVSLIPMTTLLPAMLVLKKPKAGGKQAYRFALFSGHVEQQWLKRSPLILGLTAFSILLAWVPMSRVRFDFNLLNLQSASLPSVIYQKRLIEEADRSVLYGAILAKSAEAAVALETRINGLKTVNHVDSMARYLVEDQSPKKLVIKRIKGLIADLQMSLPDSSPVDLNSLSQALWYVRGYLAFALPRLNDSDQEALSNALTGFDREIGELRGAIERSTPEARPALIRQLTGYQQSLFSDLHAMFSILGSQVIKTRLAPEDLPDPLRRRFIGRENQHLLQVYPSENLWMRANQESFISELRSVDPDATGTPVQLYEYTGLLKKSYEKAGLLAVAAIGLFVAVHFRSLLAAFLSLLPVAIGAVWTLGLMGLLETHFNPANIMTLPLIVGVGVTNGIHILNRYREETSPALLSNSTGKAVVVSSLTTISGFGSLIIADHQGITSLGWIMSIGVAACMVSSLTLLPAVIQLIGRQKRRLPGC